MNVMILGADGYSGFPACLFFSVRGHNVLGIDNYFKRQALLEVNEESLTLIHTFEKRIKIWNALKIGKEIQTRIGDITNYSFLKQAFINFQPDVVIDLAEQPSAVYSMIDYDKAHKTLTNNLVGTLNIAYAVNEVCPECTIIKLATMGEWGTPNTDIPEGFFEFEYKERKDVRLFPREGGSLYHTAKINETDLLWFYCRVWGLKVVEIFQGPIVGLLTEETEQYPELYTAFHYGEVFGTVVNRFVVQSIIGYPLTVYGKGNQTRGYLNLIDAITCFYLLAMNPPKHGEMKIINQITETFTINQLAEKVSKVANRLGFSTTIQHVDNPRIEKEEHYYNPEYTTLLNLGLEPNYLTDKVISEMILTLRDYKDRIHKNTIFKGYQWKKKRELP